MERLQAVGVASGVVQTAADVVDHDLQLKHREHWKWLEHKEMGLTMHNGQPFLFMNVDVSPSSAAPLLGEHTDEVCKEYLHLDDQQIEDLKRDVLI